MKVAAGAFLARGREGYKEYREYYNNRKVQKKDIVVNRDRYSDAVIAIGESIGELVTEKPGGVFLKKLGYFFVWMIPRPMGYIMPSVGKSVKGFNHHTNNRMYTLVFMPVKSPWLSVYSMDKKFFKPVKTRLAENLKNGIRYKTFIFDFKKYLK